jgi:hypothetical protein
VSGGFRLSRSHFSPQAVGASEAYDLRACPRIRVTTPLGGTYTVTYVRRCRERPSGHNNVETTNIAISLSEIREGTIKPSTLRDQSLSKITVRFYIYVETSSRTDRVRGQLASSLARRERHRRCACHRAMSARASTIFGTIISAVSRRRFLARRPGDSSLRVSSRTVTLLLEGNEDLIAAG